MQRLEIGPRGYVQGTAVATLSFTPQTDRAATVTDLNVTNVSATDTWVLTTAGKELARFYLISGGLQNVLGAGDSAYPGNHDIFAWCKGALDDPLEYPVPNGETLTLASVGGATADIAITYKEQDMTDITQALRNHPQGMSYRTMYYAYINAAVAAAGEIAYDTEIKPVWAPSLFTGKQGQTGYAARIKALFLQGGGVNTYSGSADHRSLSSYLFAQIGGQRMFTRAAAGGIPVIGHAAATGSANRVQTADLNEYPPFQEVISADAPLFNPEIAISPGVVTQWGLGITGDVTGTANWAGSLLLALVDVMVTP